MTLQQQNYTTIVHDRLLNEFRMLEQDYNTVLGDAVLEMIEKCAGCTKKFFENISVKEKLDKNGDNNNDDYSTSS